MVRTLLFDTRKIATVAVMVLSLASGTFFGAGVKNIVRNSVVNTPVQAAVMSQHTSMDAVSQEPDIVETEAVKTTAVVDTL